MEVVDHAQDSSGSTDFTEEGEGARSDQQTVWMRAGVGESQGSVDGIRLCYRKSNGAIEDRAQKLMQRRVRDGRLRLCAGGTQHSEAESTTLRIAQQSGLADASSPVISTAPLTCSRAFATSASKNRDSPCAAIQHEQRVGPAHSGTDRRQVCGGVRQIASAKFPPRMVVRRLTFPSVSSVWQPPC